MAKWEVLDKENVLDSKWIIVEKHKCKINDNLTIDDFYVVKKRNFVVIVVEDNNHICLIKQYRHGVGDYIINLPMGVIDEGEDPIETARRELIEETGYKSKNFEYLGEFYPSPSWLDCKCFVFYTKDPILELNSNIDDTEGELVLMKIHKNDLEQKIKNNEIKDVASIMALYIARENLKLL